MSKPFIICIDGLIGAGKSTLIKGLKKKEHLTCFFEPVTEWENLLSSFYKNPKLYGLPLQVQILIAQFCQRQRFPTGDPQTAVPAVVVVVVERCPQTSLRVFAPLVLSSSDFDVYEDLNERLAYQVDHFIYLDVDPEEAYRRIQDRSSVDSDISLEYLKELHERYVSVLGAGILSPKTIVNANQPPEVVESQIIQIIDELIKNQ